MSADDLCRQAREIAANQLEDLARKLRSREIDPIEITVHHPESKRVERYVGDIQGLYVSDGIYRISMSYRDPKKDTA